MAYKPVEKITDIKLDTFKFQEYTKLDNEGKKAYIQKVKDLFKDLKALRIYNMPLAIDPKLKQIKISRIIQDNQGMHSQQFLARIKAQYGLDVIWGNGKSGKAFPSGGHVFETKILESLQAWNDGDDAFETLDDEDLKKFVLQFTKRNKIFRIEGVEVKKTGQKNVSRPIVQKGKNFYVLKAENIPHVGEQVADITIYQHSATKVSSAVFLSLKYGKETSFFNVGLKSFIPNKFFTDDKYKLSPAGQDLLDFFGLDKDKFKETFTSYGKPGEKNNTNYKSKLTNIENIKNFVSSGIGYGYYLVGQKTESSPVNFKFLTQQFTKTLCSFALNSGTIYYRGKQGTSKKVLIEIENDFMYLRIDIRNAAGALYPDTILGYITWKKF